MTAGPGIAKDGARPRVSLIAAMAHNRVIGRDNALPWHLPADLAHFKRLTLDKPIVMGRRTWESLPGLLARRRHIVVTRDPGYRAPGCLVVGSPEEALAAAAGAAELMVIGGAALYRAMLPLAQRLYLTEIAADIAGDTVFPAWDPACWRENRREVRARDARNPYDLAFVELVRIHPDPPAAR
ncbi:dihydrofolate reductase [Thiococcus pfennigii]|uniref:dihydrofolate reductase n=1 Tax=Thiococcus pfennigii TaxID=1057 RepID=UPI001906B005|nr:dihydrofolate reductase [Thiococcus pfennigii]MBK1700739.1 dihydrofolate reductase [Thiococcus pfennigii]MBK1732377.1 dihydrofolate reductase [Thiococcus pfennigii]